MAKEPKSISEFNEEREPVFPDCETIEKEDILGEATIIEDCEFLPSSFGEGEFCIVKVKGNKTYSVSSGACLKKLKLVKEAKGFPVQARLIKRKSKATGFFYYDYE